MMKNIKITEQTFENECGICVAKSLIKFFHNINISKEELYNNVDITKDGISIFALENLLNKYNIRAESYECSFDELIKSYNKEIFITLIHNENGLHYVLCKIIKKKILIFDSAKGKNELDFEQFKSIFQNIVIFCYKSKCDIDLDFKFKKLIDYIDWKSFFITNVVSIISIVLNILGGLYINSILNNVINNKVYANLITINIIFLLSFVTNQLLILFINYFSYKNKINYTKLLQYKTLSKLSNFNSLQINKYNTNDLLSIYDHFEIISDFYSSSINRILSDFITITLSVIFLSLINWWILLILIIFTFLIIIFNFLTYILNKKSVARNYDINNDQTNTLLSFIDTLNKQFNYYEVNNIKNKLMCINLNNINFNHNIDYKQMLIKLLFSINSILFYVLLITFNVIAILDKKQDIGKMFFAISLFQMYTNSLSNLFLFYLNYPKLKYSKELLSRINNDESNDNVLGVWIDNVDFIKIDKYNIKNDTLIKGNNGSGKTTLLKSLLNLNNYYKDISINNIEYKLLSREWIKNNFIYFNNEYVINNEILTKMLNSKYQKIIIDAINKANIKTLKNINDLSTGQKQIISFLSLLIYEKKILLIDELLSNVQKDMKFYLNSEIKPIITKNNFLITVDHDRNIINKYRNILEI